MNYWYNEPNTVKTLHAFFDAYVVTHDCGRNYIIEHARDLLEYLHKHGRVIGRDGVTFVNRKLKHIARDTT